jgi:hypothetical protein
MLSYPYTVMPGFKIVKGLVIRGVRCVEPGELTRLAGSNVVSSPGSRSGARPTVSRIGEARGRVGPATSAAGRFS